MNDKLISIIIPIYNDATFLSDTLDSIFSQTYENFEVILVDDASSDDLIGILNKYSDSRLRVEHLNKNIGVSAARNIGVSLSKGHYIAFCDADDICHINRLEKQVKFLEENLDIVLCGSAFICFNEYNQNKIILHPTTNELIHAHLMLGNTFGLSTVMGRSSLFKKYNFNQNLRVAEDYELWTRIASDDHKLANLPDNLVSYRIHSQQVSDIHSYELDQVTQKIRAVYCIKILNNKNLLEHVKNENIDLATMSISANQIKNQSLYLAINFRFMLAWMYQKLTSHGLSSWYRWLKIRHELNLNLDKNYLFNIALFMLLPKFFKKKYFHILIKLKK
jgi:glycosyltransferase involved in cell wall biosynthesis